MEEEDEEEDHEVKRGIISEGLVNWSEPEQEGTGREKTEFDDRQEQLSD